MDLATKRLYAKRAKQYVTWAYISMAVGGFLTIFCFCIMNVIPAIIGGVLLIGSLLLASIGQHYINERYKYKRTLERAKDNFYFHRMIKACRENNIQKALNIHNNLINQDDHDEELCDYSYAFLISEMLHSDDEKTRSEGEKSLEALLQNRKF